MIPRDYITEWRKEVPWIENFQVEQDLIITRALVEIFLHPLLGKALSFRGGTALYKLHLKIEGRRPRKLHSWTAYRQRESVLRSAFGGRGRYPETTTDTSEELLSGERLGDRRGHC